MNLNLTFTKSTLNNCSRQEKDRLIAQIYSDLLVGEDLAALVESGLTVDQAREELQSFTPVINRKKRSHPSPSSNFFLCSKNYMVCLF